VDCIEYISQCDGLKFVRGNETLRVSISVDAKLKERKICQPIITDYFHLNLDFSFLNVKAVNYVTCSKFNRPSFSFVEIRREAKNQLKVTINR